MALSEGELQAAKHDLTYLIDCCSRYRRWNNAWTPLLTFTAVGSAVNGLIAQTQWGGRGWFTAALSALIILKLLKMV